MPQDPLLVDQIQVEPGSAGTRLIGRAADGSLQFTDPSNATGVTLSQVAGIGTKTGVLVVSQGEVIQTAYDTIPASASPSNPWALLLMPGVYSEDLVLYRDGVSIIGTGGVTIRASELVPDGPGADNTITIKADLGSIPLNALIQNCRIENIHTNLACVRVEGAAASQVGSGMLTIKDCGLVASQAGGNRPLWATSANNITWTGGSCRGSGTISMVLVEECASLTLDGVRDLTALQLDYDSGGALPITVGSAYRVMNCDSIARGNLLATPFASTLIGQGSLRITGCTNAAKLRVDGDRTLDIVGSQIGDLTILGTTAAALTASEKGAVTSVPGTTLEEPLQRGSEAFAAATSVSVVFATAQPDADYNISLEVGARPTNDETPWVTSKTAAGFDINFFTAQTLTANWTLQRVMGGATN